MKHLWLFVCMAGAMQAASYTVTSAASCDISGAAAITYENDFPAYQNGNSCLARGFDGVSQPIATAEATTLYTASESSPSGDPNWSFEIYAGAASMWLQEPVYMEDENGEGYYEYPEGNAYATAEIQVLLHFATGGMVRPGFLQYGSYESFDHSANGGFAFLLSPPQSFSLGVPFTFSMYAAAVGGASPGWDSSNSGGAYSSLSLVAPRAFEADGTEVPIFWADERPQQNDPSAVPEPATMLLTGLGMIVAVVIRRRQE